MSVGELCQNEAKHQESHHWPRRSDSHDDPADLPSCSPVSQFQLLQSHAVKSNITKTYFCNSSRTSDVALPVLHSSEAQSTGIIMVCQHHLTPKFQKERGCCNLSEASLLSDGQWRRWLAVCHGRLRLGGTIADRDKHWLNIVGVSDRLLLPLVSWFNSKVYHLSLISCGDCY